MSASADAPESPRLEQETTSGNTKPVAAAALLLAPLACAAAVVAVFTVAELSGLAPFSYTPPTNLAEATGMGLAPEVLRFLRLGSDPHRVETLRPDIISSDITRATALEAAIWSRRVELVRLLEREGAIDGDPDKRYMACLARAIQSDDIVQHLAPDGVADCDPEHAVEQLKARTR